MSERAEPATAEIAFAESLARAYASNGGDVVHMFAAFVGVVAELDAGIARDCLQALDRHMQRSRARDDKRD